MTPREKEWTDTEELAAHLDVPAKTLVQWRYLGTGPRFVKLGKHVRYRWRDVEVWLNAQYVDRAAG